MRRQDSRSIAAELNATPLGDSALLFRIAGSNAAELASALAAELQANQSASIRDACAAYETIAVYFDPLRHSMTDIEQLVRQETGRIRLGERREERPVHTIPARYDGPDLDTVATTAGLTKAEVIALHVQPEYRVRALGFAPGFAYLSDLPPALRLRRRDRPRARVPAGAIGIAERHTAVYPFETPGGWHLIGRTSTVMFDLTRSPAALLCVGDRVQFVAE
jgi:KipI family sensor histidine kinase inhibitor